MPLGVNVIDIDGTEVVEENSKISEVVYFDCKEGFKLIGPKNTTCQLNGSFDVDDDDLPYCEGEFVLYMLKITINRIVF